MLSIFESEYLKVGKDPIYVEELALILHFAVKHMGDVANDMRMSTLLTMLIDRFQDVKYEFCYPTIWSLGILVSYRGLGMPKETKLKILRELAKHTIPDDAVVNIPSLVFSISCMFLPQEIDNEVQEVIKGLIEVYLKDSLEMIEPVHASTLLLGMSRANYHNEEFLHKLATEMKRPRFFFNAADQDLVNTVTCLADLHFKDEELIQNIHEEVVTKIDSMTPYHALVLAQSYARLVPEKQEFYIDIAPRLVQIYATDSEVMDTNLYANQWLTLACFKGEHGDDRIQGIANSLQTVMLNQERFSFSDISPSEASNILVAISSIDTGKLKFIQNVVSVVNHHLKTMNTMDLINMAKSSFYLRKYDEFQHLYPSVHSELVQRLTQLEEWERKALTQIYTGHDLIPDSPFVVK